MKKLSIPIIPTLKRFSYLLLLLTTLSCNKTTYEQEKRPYNKIESFQIDGYNDLDVIKGVISEKEIKIYWSAKAQRPSNIKPILSFSAGASVLPASGTEVPFNENTVYTVTAEDGTKREYKLKIIQHKAIPVLTGFQDEYKWEWYGPDWQFAKGKKLKINGEYFLYEGDASTIRVYAQRLRDGFEFDLAVDPELSTNTQVTVDLPKLTAELDSGRHRIFVKVGDYPSNSLNVWIAQPNIVDIIKSAKLQEAGQTIYIGDKLHLTLEVDDSKMDPKLFKKYFNQENYSYYRARASFFADERYGFIETDYLNRGYQGNYRATINDNLITIPVVEEIWGNFVGIKEESVHGLHFKSELFLHQIRLNFKIQAYPEDYDKLKNANNSSIDITYADLETRHKTKIARRAPVQ